MDIYSRKTNWKIILLLAAIAFVLLSLLYTNRLAINIAKEERKRVELWTEAVEVVSRDSENPNVGDLTFVFNIIQSNKTIPLIWVDEHDKVKDILNFPERISENPDRIQVELKKLKANGNKPIEIESIRGPKEYVFYKDSYLLRMLNIFPLVQFLLIGLFLLVGYFGFSAARRAEQNQVWVGMAKETAHQLGTPLSAIVGWLEHIKMMYGEQEGMDVVLKELKKDVGRLELIAERFSKIGSSPQMEEANILENLKKNMEYMKRRAPKRVVFEYPDPKIEQVLITHINPPLFDWVLENLLRNALDAMGGEGLIKGECFEDDDYVFIDISDTGKGIPRAKQKTVFQPGFTTKKRGWGLGLSLTKRIVENYHSGKIFVKESVVNEGTTFRIQLPKKAVINDKEKDL